MIEAGKKYLELTTMERVAWKGKSRVPRWRVKCKCGKVFEMFSNAIGRQKKCRGCYLNSFPKLEDGDRRNLERGKVSVRALAKKIGVSRSTLIRRIERTGVEVRRCGMAILQISDGALVRALVDEKGLAPWAMKAALSGVKGGEDTAKEKAWQMAKEGRSMGEIGRELGVSKQRASVMVAWWCGRRVSERVIEEREKRWMNDRS